MRSSERDTLAESLSSRSALGRPGRGSILSRHLHANSFVPAAGRFDHLLYPKKSDCACLSPIPED